MLLPLQGALTKYIYPGRCPGLGASGLSARVDRLQPLAKQEGIKTEKVG